MIAMAFHHAADDRVAVDRHRDCPAHAHVAQRVLDRLAVLCAHERRVVAEVVEVQVDDAVRDHLRDVTFGSFFSRSMSVAGTSSIRSTSPASSAATRDGSDLMPRKVTRCQAGFSPQYWSLRCTTMRLPGVYSTKRYGPVPIAALPEL